jgi:hypothetical protein
VEERHVFSKQEVRIILLAYSRAIPKYSLILSTPIRIITTWYPQPPTIDAVVAHSPPFPLNSHRHGHHHIGDARHVGYHGRKGDHNGRSPAADPRRAAGLPLQTRGSSGHQVGRRTAAAAAHAVLHDLPAVSISHGAWDPR